MSEAEVCRCQQLGRILLYCISYKSNRGQLKNRMYSLCQNSEKVIAHLRVFRYDV